MVSGVAQLAGLVLIARVEDTHLPRPLTSSSLLPPPSSLQNGVSFEISLV